jgi:hypothetical protein
VIGAIAVGALAATLVCGSLVVTEPNLPTLARLGLGTGVLFGLAWLAVMVTVLRRGAIQMKTHGRSMAIMVWVFTLLMVVFNLILSPSIDSDAQRQILLASSLVFLVGAAVYWLSFKIDDAQLSVREHLLQLELRLAELAERRESPR